MIFFHSICFPKTVLKQNQCCPASLFIEVSTANFSIRFQRVVNKTNKLSLQLFAPVVSLLPKEPLQSFLSNKHRSTGGPPAAGPQITAKYQTQAFQLPNCHLQRDEEKNRVTKSVHIQWSGGGWKCVGGQLSLPACYKREDVNLTCVFPHVFSLFYICGGIVCKKKMILLNSWTSFMLTALFSITCTVIYQTQFELASPHRQIVSLQKVL